jgi:hypothetical protein
MKRALAILTDQQKAAWKQLTGEPFAHTLPLPGNAFKGGRFGVGVGGGFGGFGGFGGAGVRPLPPVAPLPPANPGK